MLFTDNWETGTDINGNVTTCTHGPGITSDFKTVGYTCISRKKLYLYKCSTYTWSWIYHTLSLSIKAVIFKEIMNECMYFM